MLFPPGSKILETVNQIKQNITICTHLSKADNVDHSMLVQNLERYGIRGMALSFLLKSYNANCSKNKYIGKQLKQRCHV